MNQSIILVHFCIDVVSRNGDVVNDFLASRFGLGETFWTDQLVLDFNLIPQQIVLSSIQYLHCGKTGSLRLSSKEQSLFLEPFF